MTVRDKSIPENMAVSSRDSSVTPAPGDSVAMEVSPKRPRKIVILHWLTVLCVCFAAAFILLRDEVVSGRVLKQWLLEGHRHFGLFVLALFFIRVVVRIRTGKLPATGRMSKPIRAAATLTHIALYALLLAQPLLGWALSNAQDRPVHLFGLTLPTLVGADEDLADNLQMWHEDAAWLLLALVLLHMGAALWHHFVVRDDVLRAMWPSRQRR